MANKLNIELFQELNTGGNCMVDVAIIPSENIITVINDEGYSVIELKDYDGFLNEISECKEFVEYETGLKVDTNDGEFIAWLAIYIVSGMSEFNHIKHQHFTYFNENKQATCYSDLKSHEKLLLIKEII